MSIMDSSSDIKTEYEFPEDKSETEVKNNLESDPTWNLNPGSVTSIHNAAHSQHPNKHTIRDRNHQVLVLKQGVLVAVNDKSTVIGEKFYVLPSNLGKSDQKNRIFLAVSDGKLCLCCDKVKESESPSLQLKKKNIEDLNSDSEKKRLPFTFIREQIRSYFTLESAANPGYFIYTSNTSGQPLGVTKDKGKEKNTNFEFSD